MPKRLPDPDKVARWKAFLKNHMPEIAAMDFVTIPTATFQLLHCLVIIHHDRRRILYFNITTNPTAAWVRQQLREVFMDDPRIRYLIHDRDTRFSGIGEWLKSAGAKSVLTSYRSPWQNGNSPDSRPVQQRPSPSAEVIAIPRVGGIYHRYEWRDAA